MENSCNYNCTNELFQNPILFKNSELVIQIDLYWISPIQKTTDVIDFVLPKTRRIEIRLYILVLIQSNTGLYIKNSSMLQHVM